MTELNMHVDISDGLIDLSFLYSKHYSLKKKSITLDKLTSLSKCYRFIFNLIIIILI